MSSMRMIYIDRADNARHTNLGLSLDTPAKTWAAFNSYRRHGVPQATATFMLDYINARGDLSGTIFLDAAGFEAITGQKAKTDAQYRRIDADYWRKAREEYATENDDAQ